MEGRFLNVRPFGSGTVGLAKTGNLVVAGKSDASHDRFRRSSEPARPKHLPAVTVDLERIEKNHLENSVADQTQQKSDNREPHTVLDNVMGGHVEPLRPSRAGIFPDKSAQDHRCVRSPKKSSTSTGSPVKRKKWKRSSSSRSPVERSQDVTILSSALGITNEVEVLESVSHKAAIEAPNAAADFSLHDTSCTRAVCVKSSEKDNVGFSNTSALIQAYIIQEAGSPGPQEEAQTVDNSVDITTRTRSFSMPATIQSPQTKRPPDAVFNNHTTAINVFFPSNASEKPDSRLKEATLPLQGRSTSTELAMRNMQQNQKIQHGGARQGPAAAKTHKCTIETVEQKCLAEASQKQFVADLLSKHVNVSTSKQQGNGQPSRASSRAASQQISIEALTAKKVSKFEKAENRPASQYPHEPLFASPKIQTQQQSAWRHSSSRDVFAKSSPRRSHSERAPLPVPTSSSPKDAKSVLLVSPVTTPTSAHSKEGTDTVVESCSSAKDNINGKEGKTVSGSSPAHVSRAHPQDKPEATGPNVWNTPQFCEVKSGQDSQAVLGGSQTQLLEAITGSTALQQEGKKTVSEVSMDMSRELPSTERQQLKSKASDIEELLGDVNDNRRFLGSEEIHAEETEQAMNMPGGFSEKRNDLEEEGLQRAYLVATQGNARQSPSRQLDIPLRTSSITRSPTPAPIMTRKKKQKRFDQIVREDEDVIGIQPSDDGALGDSRHENVSMNLKKEAPIEKVCYIF